jgi:hypothetical protein
MGLWAGLDGAGCMYTAVWSKACCMLTSSGGSDAVPFMSAVDTTLASMLLLC